MTVKLSQQKITRLLKYYFAGMTQPAIAEKLGINQGSVSLYAKRFSERAAEVGLLEAAKEYNVYKEVSELRNLSVEMHQSNLITEDAKDGVRMKNDFNRLGVPRDRHTELIQVCKKINNSGFVNAALKLVSIENESKLSYETATANYAQAVTQLPVKKNELTQIQTKLDDLNNRVTERKTTLQNLDNQFAERQKANETRTAQLEQQYTARWQQLGVKDKEIVEVSELKTKLHSNNFDIPILIRLANECCDGASQFDGLVVRKVLDEFWSLKKAIEALKREKTLLEEERVLLKQGNTEIQIKNTNLIVEVNNRDKRLADLDEELNELSAKMTNYNRQLELVLGFLAIIEGSPPVRSSIDSVITSLQELTGSARYRLKSDTELRDLFFRRVFGDYLRSFKCKQFGSGLILIPGSNIKRESIGCPVCVWPYTKLDDSFLKALLSEEYVADTYRVESLMKEYTILKPFKVLIGIPCEVCGKPISDWTEDGIKIGLAGCGWVHDKCWKTPLGRAKQATLIVKTLSEALKEETPQPTNDNDEEPPLPTLIVDI